MSDSRKQRLIATGALVAAPALVVCAVPWAHTALEPLLTVFPKVHVTLEASLNCLWILLALCGFLNWISPGRQRRRGRLPGLVGLIFVFALLFPVISADDDLAQVVLSNDTGVLQSITKSIKSHKHLPATAGSAVLAQPPATVFPPVAACAFTCEPLDSLSINNHLGATGNHSPPLS